MNENSSHMHPAQLDIYVDQLINKESPHYNIGGYIKLKGILDMKKFLEAVNSAPDVFDALKMRFDLEAADSKLYLTDRPDRPEITELDFSKFENPADDGLSWMQSRFNTPFTINKNSLLLEHSILKISDDEHWLFGRFHHLINDGFGFLVYVQYLAQKYKSLLSESEEGSEFKYPSYLEEIKKANEYLNSDTFKKDKEYWEEKINERPEKFLHRKYIRPESSDHTSSKYVRNFKEEKRLQLEEISAVTNSGLQQLTLAALLIYFGKTTEQSEFVFGVPVHKRGSKVLRNIIGMFSGVLPFKGSFDKDRILADHLKEISQTQRSDYRHQNYPLSAINRNLKDRTSDEYLYEISVNYEPLNFDLDFGSDIESGIARLESDGEQNPLQFFWRDYGNREPLQLIINYSKEYFSHKEIELLSERLIYIIEQFPANLDKQTGNIKILPGREVMLLNKFNNTSAEFSEERNLVKLFEEQVAETPDYTALDFAEQNIPYKVLNERSNQLSHYLRSKGIGKDVLVPICIERSAEMIVGIIGILKAGGAYVPIDPEYPGERISYMLKDTNASLIVSSKKCKTSLPADDKYEVVSLDEDHDILKKLPVENPGSEYYPNRLAYVIYTSGSTGKPKGVMIEHYTVANLIKSQSNEFKINSNDRILQFSNYSFDASVEQIFLALCNGSALVLFEEGFQLDSDRFEKFLKEKKITHLHATPSFIENIKATDLPSLKRVIAGGDVCKKELADFWKDKVEFYNEYGPTETTVTAIEYTDKPGVDNNISLPIGKPLSNIRVYFLNKQNEICPVGVEGELCIAGECLARGYLNQPELTAEKFVTDPLSYEPGSLMYKTGDIGRWITDGNIEYLGRIDEQVKIRGYRIELGEIESVLQESDLVRNSVVLAKPDSSGNKRLIAYVIPGGKLDRERIQEYLKTKLPDYMIPAIWVEIESLPLTKNGKVDRKALPDPDVSENISSEYEAPDSEMEITLTEMWRELFDIERVGANDNFFELGGHSLNAIQLSSKLNKLLNIKTDIGTIFSNPTVRKLAKALIREKQNQFTEITLQPEKDHYDLSHSQKRFWVLSKFKDGSEAYNVSNVFDIEGKLNVETFKSAFDAVIGRHEILRTVFTEVNNEPMQKILTLKDAGFKISEFDLRGKTDSEQTVKKYLDEDSKRAFDLETGPLLRAALFQTEENRYKLVINIHHIISDGWSKGIFLKEFVYFYKAITNKEESKLEDLPVQYKDYAGWHKLSFEKQGKFWRDLYSQGIPVLDFKTDNERPKVLSYFGEMVHSEISESLTSELQKAATDNNMSLNNLMLIIYGMAVTAGSDQEDVVIGTVSSGRSHPDLENLIGVFINFLPVKLSPERHLKMSEYLSNSQSTLVKAFNNQDYPFDLMVEDNIKKRDISRNPFFDTMINFQMENDSLENFIDKKDTAGITIRPQQKKEDALFQTVLDFKLDVVPESGKMNLYLSYNSKLYSKQRMNDLLEDYIELLNKTVTEPDNYLSQYINRKTEEKNINMEKNTTEEVKAMPVNICSSFVIEPVEEFMEYWSKEFDLNIKVNFAPYNQVFQQLINPGSLLYGDKGINILFIRPEDWLRDQKDLSASEQTEFLDKTYAELTSAILNLRKQTFIPFLVGLVPVYPGSKISDAISGHIDKIIIDLEKFFSEQPSFQILDLDKIAELYDVDEIYDPASDKMGHMPFTPEYYAAIGTYLTRKVSAFMNTAYKVIALDCDNTLWKGICGEAGAMNVEIDENYSELQEFFIEKYNEGFLLVLCSKNNEDDVWEVFDKHPGMKLKREHIAAHRINWDPKPENLLSVAKELNLGINSFIFIDDNEFETEQMNVNCPDVLPLTLPEDPDEFLSFVNHIWAFDFFRITDEDRKRNEMYKVEKLRKEEEGKHGTLDDYLKTLEIKVDIRPIEPKDLERAVQLTLRTNQFNLNGIRKTPEEVSKYINGKNSLAKIVEVRDRFGDYGIVGLILAEEKDNTLVVETFLLSCRVLGRNVEGTILSELKNYCSEKGLERIALLFQPTLKNKPFQEFLENYEWEVDSQTKAHSMLIKTGEQILV